MRSFLNNGMKLLSYYLLWALVLRELRQVVYAINRSQMLRSSLWWLRQIKGVMAVAIWCKVKGAEGELSVEETSKL